MRRAQDKLSLEPIYHCFSFLAKKLSLIRRSRAQIKAFGFRTTKYHFCMLMLLSTLTFQTCANTWTKLAPGIEYQDLNTSVLSHWSHIHVFRIDLNHNKLHSIMANMFAHNQAFAHEFANHSNALIAINGGFFDQQHHSLGLRISNHRQYNPLKQISWWGVFYIKDNVPYISKLSLFSPDKQINFAVQSGPRLLINGDIPALKPGYAERTALGITANHQVIILVTENNPVTTTWLAENLKAPPLNCVNALNLDGGSSSQLYAKIGSFKINAPNFVGVSDAIVVKPIK